jgi:hypothetical protein
LGPSFFFHCTVNISLCLCLNKHHAVKKYPLLN